jgi:hypothetical protein
VGLLVLQVRPAVDAAVDAQLATGIDTTGLVRVLTHDCCEGAAFRKFRCAEGKIKGGRKENRDGSRSGERIKQQARGAQLES